MVLRTVIIMRGKGCYCRIAYQGNKLKIDYMIFLIVIFQGDKLGNLSSPSFINWCCGHVFSYVSK